MAKLPELPETVAHIWDWFVSLRHDGKRLSFPGIEAWQRLRKVELEQQELDIILQIDRLYD